MGAVTTHDVVVDIEGHRILHGVDLQVEPGAWVNVIGPNGAGKTTLLRTILGTMRHGGRIEYDGSSLGHPSERARRLAYVPQSPVIPPGMYVADYVLLGRTPHRGIFGRDSDTDRSVAAEVLERLDLAAFARREVGSLSGGERQRVVLARALAQQTPVLLLDEPTTALDLGHQQDVLDLVESLRHERRLTVIATLHDLTLAARYGDRIALLAAGRIVQDGPPAEVLTTESIAEHFGAHVRIIDDPDGPVIVPAPPQRSQP
jgi:iron complex transport system ATP-binding protein